MSKARRIGYVRLKHAQQTSRMLDGLECDRVLTDAASDKGTDQPQRTALLARVRAGDTIVACSMAGLACDMDDLRRIVLSQNARGVHVQFIRENLLFFPGGSPMTDLFLTMLAAVAEFKRALVKEHQLEGIALARQRGAYRGRTRKLSAGQAAELRARAAAGEKKARLAREFGISRETLYQYLRAT